MEHTALDPVTVLRDLGTTVIPQTISCHGAVGSTMDLARELLGRLEDSQLPALVVADEQTAGRGRMGRPWVAPPGSALLVSLVLRPRWMPLDQGARLVWMTAVALCEAVEAVTPLRPALKWPNDLLVAVQRSHDEQASVAERSDAQAPSAAADHHAGAAAQVALWAKAAGILLEVTMGAEGIETAIIGCGVNVSAAPPATATRYPATSLAAAAGVPVSRLELLRALLRRLDAWYTLLQAGESEALFAAWRARLVTLGQHVRIETPSGVVEGMAEAVERSGALIVRDAAGRLHNVTAGDVGLTP